MSEQRVCEITKEPFEVTSEEIKAYQSFDLPLPTLGPNERFRRALSFLSGGYFFWRKCALTKERVFSAYSKALPFPVVANEAWDRVDVEAYARDYDQSETFFRQLYDLWRSVPRPALNTHKVKRSLVVHESSEIDRSFVLMHSHDVLDSLYCLGVRQSERCCDCLNVYDCADCYECINCHSCTNVRWGESSQNCDECSFIFNCKDCTNCLFCYNLEGKSYHVFNKPVSEEEYRQRVQELNLTARVGVEASKEKFYDFIKQANVPHIYAEPEEGVFGNYLYDCESAIHCFECSDSKNLISCNGLYNAENCLDGNGFGDNLKDSAQFVSVGHNAKNIINSVECRDNVSNLEYCFNCENSSNLFGCVGLSGAEYCVLNKQYIKKQYESLVSLIKSKMDEEGKKGAYLPSNFSQYAYNHSAANLYMPLNHVQASMFQFIWDEDSEHIRPSQLAGEDIEKGAARYSENLDRLEEVAGTNIEDKVFLCEITGKPFQINKRERELYVRFRVAPPARSFEQRHRERLMRLSSKKLHAITSAKSGEALLSAFPNSWKHPVVSRSEWKKEVAKNSSGG